MRLNRFLAREAERPSPGFNICGVLVHVDPARLDGTCAALSALPGLEVHSRGADGRLVVTLEDAPGTTAALTLAGLPAIAGVASASLVYHHCITEDPSEEMPS